MQPHVPVPRVDVIEHWFAGENGSQHHIKAEKDDDLWVVVLTEFSKAGVAVSQHTSASVDEIGMAKAMRTLMEIAGCTLTH